MFVAETTLAASLNADEELSSALVWPVSYFIVPSRFRTSVNGKVKQPPPVFFSEIAREMVLAPFISHGLQCRSPWECS